MNDHVNKSEDGIIHARGLDLLGNDHAYHDENDDVRDESDKFPKLMHEMLDLRTDPRLAHTRQNDPEGD